MGTGFHGELSGRENIYLNGAVLGMSHAEIRRKFDQIVDFADVERFLDTPVKRYSSGMYVRLAFAVAAHLEPEILIVDEVLAVGDADFQKKCLGKMGEVAGHGRTVLFVSHNMASVASLCTRGILLDRGRVRAQGSVPDVIAQYAAIARPAVEGGDVGALFTRDMGRPVREAALLGLALLDKTGAPVSVVESFATVTFRATGRIVTPVDLLSLAIFIKDSRGLVVAKFESGRNPPTSAARAGDFQIDCEIRDLPLRAGDYTINVGVGSYGLRWLDIHDDAATFSVSASSDEDLQTNRFSEGAIIARHVWRTQASSAAAEPVQ